MFKKSILFFLTIFSITLFAFKTNRSDYFFDLRLDDEKKEIVGYEIINYKNFSKDTLDKIVFHLYANYFKNGSSFFEKKIDSKKEGFTQVDSIFEDGERNDSFFVDETVGYLKLKRKVLPNDSISIKVYFKNKVPYPFLREGYSNGKYDISQWYPKVAVYKNKKWADFKIGRNSEFFNEYGDYFLKIEIPKKYFLFSTGRVEYEKDDSLFLDSLLKDKNYKYKSDKSNDTLFKVVKVSAKNVNDIAFSLRKDFSYIKKIKDGLEVEIVCERKNYDAYNEFVDNVFGIVKFYSEKYFPYPYDKLTIVDGLLRAGGGMEYPQFIVMGPILNIDKKFKSIVDYKYLDDVICHEIAHQWFYLISGSNEAIEPFMDEGFATYSEISYMENRFQEKNQVTFLGRKVFDLFTQHYLNFLNLQKNKKSVPINYSSLDTEDYNYMIFYSKGYLIIKNIENLFGKDTFSLYMKEYFERYNFSHPSIEEFYNFLNEKSEGKYKTYLKYLIYENVYTDFYLSKVFEDKDNVKFVVKNNSLIDLPVDVRIDLKDKSSKVLRCEVDKDTIELKKNIIKNIVIDPTYSSLDIKYTNNFLKKKIKIHIFPEIFDIDAYNLYIFPFYQYTVLEKTSLGINLMFFDLPKLSNPYFSVIGDFDSRLFAGYNIKNRSFYIDGEFNSYQDGNVGNGIVYKFTKELLKVEPKFFYFQNEKDFDQIFEVSYSFRKSLSPSDYFRYILEEGKVASFNMRYNFYKKFDDIKLKGDIDSKIYSPVIYSDFKSAKLKVNLDASYDFKFFKGSVGYDGEFLKDESNKETSINLFSKRGALFDRIDRSFQNYGVTLTDISSGYGYLIDTTKTYFVLNRLRFKLNFVYQDLIIAGRDMDIFYQTGLIFRMGDFGKIEIPIYNKEKGLIIKDNLNILFNFNLFKLF
uniref:Peptidase M1 membrane alanine aminopeptidase domain-containing protein n=1 Tax=candidate division WOR-3 bacterium TaxID=2052148 RepID=A0A7C3NG82_UNCW3